MITHGVHWLPLVDHIVVITDGCVSEVGSYDELIDRKGDFAEFLQKHFTEQGADYEEIEDEEGSVIDKIEEICVLIIKTYVE